jgi:serine/threonine-protein kinase
VVDGRYRVVGHLGSGGMGIVYRVEHLHLGKTAAMKVLAPATAGKPEMVRRFRLEAQAVSKLNHPNIVQTFDFGECDGALYLVMEFIKGDDLAGLLRRDGPWPFRRTARLFAQVCSALTEAHEAGIIHRDLKPENLMVVSRRDGEHVKVLDFGLAKLRERHVELDGIEAGAISSGNQVLGTPYYMAPEQVRGEALDPRADLYSLGATLYRVLTGEPPFDAPSPMSILSRHLTDELVPPRRRAPDRALPLEADAIVLRAMAKARDDRYASAAELQRDLERALVGADAGGIEDPPPPVRRGRARGDATTVALDEGAIVEDRADSSTSVTGDGRTDSGGDDRLRRADVDEYEWSLRRKHLLLRLVLPVVVLAGLGGGGALVWRALAEHPVTVEREPNNSPATANLIPRGVPVRGTIGKLIDDHEGDVDYFRVPAGKGPRAVSARLQGIPNVDLVLELFDTQGQRLAKSDAGGRGRGEWLQPTVVGPSEAYLSVREVWVQGQKPTEDAPDPYVLTADWGAPLPGWEVEPNDWPTAATVLAAPGRVRGYLGSAEDQDWYAISVTEPMMVAVSVTAPAGVDVVLLREGEKSVVNRNGRGGGEQLTVPARPGETVLVAVARKSVGRRDVKPEIVEGIDDPYELTVSQVDE